MAAGPPGSRRCPTTYRRRTHGPLLVVNGETVWRDGPLTIAARQGAICYLDELVEARSDTIVVIHPLADDRRVLSIDKTGELVQAAPGFQLVVSYNPGYQQLLKELKPSTRQRFVALEFALPASGGGAMCARGRVPSADCRHLVDLAVRLRRLEASRAPEVASPGFWSLLRVHRCGHSASDACGRDGGAAPRRSELLAREPRDRHLLGGAGGRDGEPMT